MTFPPERLCSEVPCRTPASPKTDLVQVAFRCGFLSPLFGKLILLLGLVGIPGPATTAQPLTGGVPSHEVNGSFVREWLVLGPFLRRETSTDFLVEAGGEANARPREGDIVTRTDGTQLKWTLLRSQTDMLNPAQVIEVPDFSVFYAYCELTSDQPLDSYLRSYSTAPGGIWLNGKNIGPCSAFIGAKADIPPVLPIQLQAGSNSLLLKLNPQVNKGDFLVQPLPAGWKTINVVPINTPGQPVPGALIEFYQNGEVYGRVTGDAGAPICMSEGTYDLRVTSGDRGAWRRGVTISAQGPERLEIQLTNSVSISGRVQAMDQSPQSAIVVQAIRIGPEAASQGQTPPFLADSLPRFSETVLTETNGNFRFVNLLPGEYQVRCQAAEGFIEPDGSDTNRTAAVILVGPPRLNEGVIFTFPRAKKGVWKNYQLMEGLMEVQPRAVERTADGRMWIGTDQSFLYTYDGVEFKLAASAPDIPANEITSVETAVDQTLWVGTSAGITRYANNRIEKIPLPERGARNYVNDILAEPEGVVWIGTSSGLFKYHRGVLSSIAVGQVGGSEREAVNSLLRARDGSLWIGTSRGLFQLDGTTSTVLEPPSGFGGRSVAHLHQAKDGAIWFTALPQGGAYRFDGKNFTRIGKENGLLSERIDDISETSDGSLWFATKMGLSRWNGRTMINYTKEDGLSNEWVRNILVDSDDVLWCANGWGLSRFDPVGFLGFSEGDGLFRGPGPTEVLAIEPEADGNVLIGTAWRGLFRSDGKTIHRVNPELSDAYVRSIHRSADGTLWFGTATGIIKQERGQFVKVLARNWVLALCSDSHGNIWFGHGWNGGGVTRFNPNTGEETSFGVNDGLPDDHVWTLEPGSDGVVWIGTGGGLARHKAGRIDPVPPPRGFSESGVFHLRRDADDVLWVGSREGLDRVKGNERVRAAGVNGLPGQHIWCTARTSDGKVWMATERHGLLGSDGRAVTMLDKRDGMVGNSAFTVVTNRDKSMWIGFLDGGLTRYQPSKLPPSVRLHGMLVDNQTVTNLLKPPSVAIGRRVTFQYQEIDQKTHPEKRQFWYRLSDQTRQTVYAAITRERRFDWVPEKRGSYNFEVQAIDRDLNYSKAAGVLLKVVVPWHANPWVLVPGAVAFIGLLAWAFVVRALYLTKSREAVVLGERVRIARDLHDNLGAGLTHLAMVGDLVREKVDQPESVQMLATRLSVSARELTRTMGEIIWAMDSEKDTLRSFALFLTRYAERFFAESPVRLRFDIPPELPDIMLPTEVRNSLFMVAKEALNNVAKHAEASEVQIRLGLLNRDLQLEIVDNGQGFTEPGAASTGHGLKNMRKRLRELCGLLRIESTTGRGTRIYAWVRLNKK